MAFPEFDKPVPTRPFKRGGKWLTSGLFREIALSTYRVDLRYHPIFTLNEDREGYINARKTFIQEGDRSGYKWAMKYLGDWQHWQKLMGAPWFVELYDKWVEELDAKLEAEAVDIIRGISRDDANKSQLAAARLLHSLTKIKPESKGRGRPKNSQTDLPPAQEATDEDFERLGLTLIKGGKV